MQSLILWREDESDFDADEVDQMFRSQAGFDQIRFDEPGGALIEATYAT